MNTQILKQYAKYDNNTTNVVAIPRMVKQYPKPMV